MNLFAFMSIFAQFFLAFVGRNFPQFTFSSAGHLILLILAQKRLDNLRLIPQRHKPLYNDYAEIGNNGQVYRI